MGLGCRQKNLKCPQRFNEGKYSPQNQANKMIMMTNNMANPAEPGRWPAQQSPEADQPSRTGWIFGRLTVEFKKMADYTKKKIKNKKNKEK